MYNKYIVKFCTERRSKHFMIELYIIIFNLTLFIHNIFYLELVNRIFGWESSRAKIITFSLASCTLGTTFLVLFGSMSTLGYTIMLVVYGGMISLYSIGRKNLVKTMLAALVLTFNVHIMSVRGIISAIASLGLDMSICKIMQDETLFWIILSLTSVFTTMLTIAILILVPKKYLSAITNRTEFVFCYFAITALANIYMITNGTVYITQIDYEELPFHQIVASLTWLLAMYSSMFMLVISDLLRQRKEKLEKKLASESVYKQALIGNTHTIMEICCSNDYLFKVIVGNKEEILSPGLTYTDYITNFCNNFVHVEDQGRMMNHSLIPTIITNFENGNQRLNCDYRMKQSDDNYKWVKDTITIHKDEETGNIIAIKLITDDIHEMKMSEERLINDNERDYLVGAYNRKTTEKLIKEHLENNQNGVMLLLDLDNFKAINDNMGHAYGDNVLKEFYEAIASNCRKDDIIGRLGGDEFIVFFKNSASVENISAKAQRICQAAHRSYTSDTSSVVVTISSSIGIAIAPDNATTYDELYNCSDIAMYSCKKAAKNAFAFYNEEMDKTKTKK